MRMQVAGFETKKIVKAINEKKRVEAGVAVKYRRQPPKWYPANAVESDGSWMPVPSDGSDLEETYQVNVNLSPEEMEMIESLRAGDVVHGPSAPLSACEIRSRIRDGNNRRKLIKRCCKKVPGKCQTNHDCNMSHGRSLYNHCFAPHLQTRVQQ